MKIFIIIFLNHILKFILIQGKEIFYFICHKYIQNFPFFLFIIKILIFEILMIYLFFNIFFQKGFGKKVGL